MAAVAHVQPRCAEKKVKPYNFSMMKRALVFAVLLLSACTTVSNGPMQRVYVDSEPQGADVEVRNCGAMATKTIATPGVVWVSRRSTQCQLVVRKSGFTTEHVRLARHVASAMDRYADGAQAGFDSQESFSDGLFVTALMLIPSFAVDAASGAMFELQPSRVVVTMKPAADDWRENPAPPSGSR